MELGGDEGLWTTVHNGQGMKPCFQGRAEGLTVREHSVRGHHPCKGQDSTGRAGPASSEGTLWDQAELRKAPRTASASCLSFPQGPLPCFCTDV